MAREGRARLHADAEHDHVRRVLVPRRRGHRADPALLVGEDLRDLGAGDRTDAHAVHRAVHQAAHVRVQRGHRLLAAVQDGDLVPPPDQGLRHLHADVARADDDRPAALRALQRVHQPSAVVQGLDAVDPVRADARDPGTDRAGARREDEFVVARPGFGSAVQIAGADPAAREVQLHHLGPGAHVDVARPVFLGGTGDQVVPLADQAADPVRDPARRVRGEVPALEGDDLQLRRALEPPGL